MKKMHKLVACKCKKEAKKTDQLKNILFLILAVLGAVTAVIGIAYAVYHYCTTNSLENFEDDFEDDFEDEDSNGKK